jgi:hypothetical protein
MIDLDDLKETLSKEKWQEKWKDIESQNKSIEIARLKLQLQNPTYYQKGDRGNPWTPPITYAVERENEAWMDLNRRAVHIELEASYATWMNIITCMCLVFCSLLWWAW